MIVNLHVTLRCNLRCDYCYASKAEARMTPEVAEAAIRLAEKEARDRRALFPSCATRRMVSTAAHLATKVLPDVAVRQKWRFGIA